MSSSRIRLTVSIIDSPRQTAHPGRIASHYEYYEFATHTLLKRAQFKVRVIRFVSPGERLMHTTGYKVLNADTHVPTLSEYGSRRVD